jgi:DNA polymerase III epsilon subunit-like protein
MTDLVFVDTETTGLADDDEIWEFAAIRRTDGVDQEPFVCQIKVTPQKLDRLPEPFLADAKARYRAESAIAPYLIAKFINRVFDPDSDGQPPYLVGANPAFDAAKIEKLLRDRGYEPRWHYRLQDVEALTSGLYGSIVGGLDACLRHFGLNPDDYDRHTALGDAQAAMDVWDAVMTKDGR